MTLVCVSLVQTLPQKLANPNAKFALLIMSFVLFSSMLLFLVLFGLTPWKLLHIFSTFCPLNSWEILGTYTHLRTFGCLCYPLISSSKIHKLQPHSKPCVFLGYPSSHRGYKCYDPSSHKIILSRHVMFDESVFPFTKLSSSPSIAYDFLDENMHPALSKLSITLHFLLGHPLHVSPLLSGLLFTSQGLPLPI